jgi:signal peptidase I
MHLATPRAATPRARHDRRVRKEAALLVREARDGVARVRDLPPPVKAEVTARADALAEALAAGRTDEVKDGLVALDALIGEHLPAARKSTVREYGESIAIAVIIALLLRAFVIEAFKIPSSSMIPTMQIGDHIFVNKFLYGVRIPYTRTKFLELRKPRRGEVIVFMNPCTPEKDFIKRVVAIAGDTVEVRCHILYINGEPVSHELVEEYQLDGTGCQYWDTLDTGWKPAPDRCARYEERLGAHAYSTLHPEDRPARDRARREEGEAGTYWEWRGERDFPDLASTRETDRLVAPVLPRCGPGDVQRPPEQAGRVVRSVPPGEATPGACDPRAHFVVPDGTVFVLGDNRTNSHDSRAWGTVPLDHIKGKALFIWWSDSEKSGVRWRRMGSIVE